MRLAVLLVLTLSAPLAAQTPGTVFTPEPSAASRTDEALAELPSERYGTEWGMTRADVRALFRRSPAADDPEGLTYFSLDGTSQTVFLFEPDATGTDRLAGVVATSPTMVYLRDALAEMDQFKAAFIHRFGAPEYEDDVRPGSGDPPVLDTAWRLDPAETEGARAVEITLDHAALGHANPDGTPALGHFFYVRALGPLVRPAASPAP